MRNRPLCFVFYFSGSARVSPASDRFSRSRTFLVRCREQKFVPREKIVSARRRNQHARRVRSPIRFALLFVLVLTIICSAQDFGRSAFAELRRDESTTADGDKLPEA